MSLFNKFKEITGIDANEIASKYLNEKEQDNEKAEEALDRYFQDIENHRDNENIEKISKEEEEKKESMERIESPKCYL